MREKSKKLFNLKENLSIDEAIIKFHGKHSGVVGAPNRPAKRGYKITPLQVDTLSMCGILKFIYVHPNGRRDSPRELWKRCAKTRQGKPASSMWTFYTSIPLALSLLKKKIYLCGSFNTSRKQWPNKLKTQKTGCYLKKLKRGDFICKQSEDGKMLASVWKDSSLLFNLTTCHNHVQGKFQERSENYKNRKTVSLNPTEGFVAYNKFMGGVGRHHHLRTLHMD